MRDLKFQIWDAADAQDREAWIEYWEQWPAREVFAHPAYVNLYSTPHSRALCATWSSGNLRVLYPFLLRDLTVEPFWRGGLPPASDMITPYGYGGPFAWGDCSRGAGSEFWPLFDDWARSERIVSEFVRLSLFPDTLLAYPGERTVRSHNIVRHLDLDADALWMDFEHKVRKNVNRARREGVVVKVDTRAEKIEDFLEIYRSTMHRRNAEKGYYFTEAFFKAIRDGLSGQFAYFHAYHNGRIVSTELVLISAQSVYSFLGGTVEEAFALRPNDLLKYEIMLWTRELGKRHFVLGGGYAPDDGIYRYKQSFAPGGSVPFFTGARVLAPELYLTFVENSRAVAAQRARPLREGYFPAYRA
jgi:hypothetical protein